MSAAKHVNVALFVPHLGCPHRCVFCDQRAITGSGSAPLTPERIAAACETALRAPHDPAHSEIAFFGGSFTAIPRETQRMCLEAAAPYLKTGFSGVRVSTRPDCIDEETLSFLKSYRVTAVELGAQSMDNAVLSLSGRGHTAAQTVRAAALIKAAGLSLGLQMMTGLPGSTPETDCGTALALRDLGPDTVRIYPTVVLKNTRLAELYAEGRYVPQTLPESVRLCARLLQVFHGAGIPVIRLGLHSGGDVLENYIAGPYHPAFRELCEGALYGGLLGELLRAAPPGEYTVYTAPGEVSKAVGHRRENALAFARAGYRLKFKESPAIAPLNLRVEAGPPHLKGNDACI